MYQRTFYSNSYNKNGAVLIIIIEEFLFKMEAISEERFRELYSRNEIQLL